MSEVYGVSQVALLKYHAGGMKFRELQRAANLASISGKSLDDVIWMKVEGNKEQFSKSLKQARWLMPHHRHMHR